jgi:hypothetical protein
MFVRISSARMHMKEMDTSTSRNIARCLATISDLTSRHGADGEADI